MIKKIIKLAGTSLVFSALCVGVNAKTVGAIDKVYLKAGVGAMQFDKFKATNTNTTKYTSLNGETVEVGSTGYLKKAPKTSPTYNIGIGYRFSDQVRSDLNLQYSEIKYKVAQLKQNIKTLAAFVNGYYDINFNEHIVPYVTAGIGIGSNDAGSLKRNKTIIEGKRKTSFIWNVGLGAQYNINKNFAVDLGYRYMDLGTSKTDNGTSAFRGGKQKIRGNQVMGSLVYNF